MINTFNFKLTKGYKTISLSNEECLIFTIKISPKNILQKKIIIIRFFFFLISIGDVTLREALNSHALSSRERKKPRSPKQICYIKPSSKLSGSFIQKKKKMSGSNLQL